MAFLHSSSLRKEFSLPSLPPTVQLRPPSSVCSPRWGIEKWRKSNLKNKGFGSPRFLALSGKSGDLNLEPQNPFHEVRSSNSKAFQRKLEAFYVFLRPHAIVGDVAPIISVSLFALEKVSDISPLFFIGLSQAIVAAVFMHVYVCGLNELTDMNIDKVNKPHRPLVSGEFSANTVKIIIASSAIMSFWIVWIVGSRPLLCAIFAHFVLGTAYSINVPFLRWKRFPLTATLCILAMQVFPSPIAFYLHLQTFVFGRPALFPKAMIVGTGLMSIFSVVISNFKDIPDVDGDRLDGINTLAVKLGSKKVFWICIGLVQIVYLGSISVALMQPHNWRNCTLVASQVIFTLILWNNARSVDLGSNTAVETFFRLLWKLFFAEYFIIHLMR